MVEKELRESARSVSTRRVLQLVDGPSHSEYDCEHVALAQALNVMLVTGDRTVADLFSETAVLLEVFASRGGGTKTKDMYWQVD